MGRLVVVENLTLDGVMQAPGGIDEDTRGGFQHGGWARPYADHVMAEVMGKEMSQDGVMVFGRRTYEQFYSFWPKQTDGNPYTDILNRMQKYVVSRTMAEPLSWENSSLLTGPAVDEVAAIKRDTAGQVVVLGSGELVRALGRGASLTNTCCQSTPSCSVQASSSSPTESTHTERSTSSMLFRRRPA